MYRFFSSKIKTKEPKFEEVEESIFSKYEDKSIQVPETLMKLIFGEVPLKAIPKKLRYDHDFV